MTTNSSKPISASFAARAQEYALFWQEHQTNPSNTNDSQTTSLSKWLTRARTHASETEQALLDSICGYWRSTKVNVPFGRRVRQLQDFYTEHGRTPTSKDGRDYYDLIRWLKQTLQDEESSRIQYLDERLPWWRSALDGKPEASGFTQNADDLSRFFAQRGRLPMRNLEDAEENQLYNWLSRIRRSHTSAQAEMLDARVKNWRQGSSSGTFRRSNAGRSDWDRVVRDTATFYSTHQRFPDAPGQVPGEAKLASWLTAAKTVPAMAQLRTALDTTVPGWRDTPAQRNFTARMDQLARFRRSHPGSWPAPDSRDKDEQQLAWWLSKMSWLHKPQYHRALDQRFPGWRTRTDPVTPAPRTLTKTTPEPSRA